MTRLNFTGRKRIHRRAIFLHLEVMGGVSTITANLDLNIYEFPADASVLLEARRQTTYMRFEMGTIGRLRSLDAEPLTLFGGDGSVTFTVKVAESSPDGHGKVLGLAKNLRPASPDDDQRPKGILPFRASDDLGQLIWRLDLSGDEPVVLINRSVGDWNGFARSREFCTLVFPELLRSIALWVVDMDPEDESASPWVKFLRVLGLNPVDAPDEEEARGEWADEVAFAFAGRHHFLDVLREEADQ